MTPANGDVPRVLHIVASLDTGGTEMWAVRLLEYWRDTMEQHVVVLDRSSGALDARIAAVAAMEVLSDVETGPIGAAAIYRRVRAALSTYRADAVFIHSFGVHHVAAALAARSRGIRNVAAAAGNPPPRDARSRAKWRAVLLASRLAGCPVSGCSYAVDAQLRSLGVGMPARSAVIPCGVDVPPTVRARPIDPAAPRLAMVARLDEIKDHATLIRAFALVHADRPAARLLIIGDGPQRPGLEALAGTLGLLEAVDFVGRRLDVPELLAGSDLFVFSTTRAEGFGIVLIEAMAAGLPIVASDVPACAEVLDRGNAGVLTPAGDPEAMAMAILALLDDPARAAAVAAAGAARLAATYSIATCADRWRALLRLPA